MGAGALSGGNHSGSNEKFEEIKNQQKNSSTRRQRADDDVRIVIGLCVGSAIAADVRA